MVIKGDEIMQHNEFKAFVVEERNGIFKGEVRARQISDLTDNDLLIRVRYSSLNYKDALSVNGNKGVTKTYPHTPGIDAVGTVVSSKTDRFKTGDNVIVTSYDLGMNTDGGFGEFIRVPEGWAVKLPGMLSMKEAMIFGTAGLTAGMSVLRLIEIVKPADGTIVVSGATGGVGTLSVAILKKLGYKVAAITGKEVERNYLLKLGAETVILRKEFESLADRSLLKPAFAGGIDTVGGVILENIIKSTSPMGAVTCCGNVASPDLRLTVFPFILRGVTLIGIDSQNYPMSYRQEVWNKLADVWKPDGLDEMCTEISFKELNGKIGLMLKGQLKGRTVLDLES
jgi:putative YhdH/YhfP family quinone oxidoreductase